jgi:hypothetical protein
MRSFLSVAFASTLILPASARAQELPSPNASQRLLLSAGPGRTFGSGPLTGLHVRAEYSLTRLDRVIGMRVHLGAFWTPSQSFSTPSILYGEGSTFEGFGQSAHLDLGVTGSVTPWPQACVSPYVVGGVAALQQWRYGSGYYRRPDGTVAASLPPGGGTEGGFTAVVGAGLRFRVGRHLWQLEARQLRGHQSTLSLGTALRF